MKQNEFQEIQRGNGVTNDNLATLADIMKASLSKIHDKIHDLETKIIEIDQESLPRQKSSYRLLVISIIISIISLLF